MKNITIRLKANESKIFPIFWDGKQNQNLTITAVLDKPGASLKLLGIFLASKNSLKLCTRVIHKAQNTYSRTIIRGVLDGRARADFEGLVQIEKGAKNTDADLKTRTILLSPKAYATAIPRLEVQENQVKAGHGAAVGKIDDEQIFYLMSRGLTRKQSKNIIIKGFLESLLPEFPQKKKENIKKLLLL